MRHYYSGQDEADFEEFQEIARKVLWFDTAVFTLKKVFLVKYMYLFSI